MFGFYLHVVTGVLATKLAKFSRCAIVLVQVQMNLGTCGPSGSFGYGDPLYRQSHPLQRAKNIFCISACLVSIEGDLGRAACVGCHRYKGKCGTRPAFKGSAYGIVNCLIIGNIFPIEANDDQGPAAQC